MIALAASGRGAQPREDHFVHLFGATWADYQRMLKLRGDDRSAPRITYFDGLLEIVTLSLAHELIKSVIGRLVETWCLEQDMEFSAAGSWTLQNKLKKAGLEPDECYVFGRMSAEPKRPDLAIEVVWTSGGIDKLDVYSEIGVREVWYWRRGIIRVYRLRADRYRAVPHSIALPGIDLAELASFLDRPTTSQAIRDYRAALHASAAR